MTDIQALKTVLSKAWESTRSAATGTSRSVTSRRAKVRLVIGLDFGTSTSKVIVAGKMMHSGEILRTIVKDLNGGLLIPSVLQMINRGCIAFVPVSRHSPVIRSIKSALQVSPHGSALDRHIRQLTGLDSDAICYGYLSHLVHLVRAHLEKHWPQTHYEYDELVWCMGAPVGLSSWAQLSQRYQIILQAAVDDPAPLDSHYSILAQDLQERFKIACSRPPKAFCAVLPEALVIISAFILGHQGRIDPGMYCLVDVGAGTTDATWFRYDPSRLDKPVLIYSGASVPIAGDRINTALKREYPNEVHAGWTEIPGLHETRSLQELIVELCHVRYSGMVLIGRREPPSTFLNAPVNLVLMGGGSRIARVARALAEPIRSQHDRLLVRARFHVRPFQAALPSVQNITELHALALGLSYHPGEHPGFLDRHEIDELSYAVNDTVIFDDHLAKDD